MFVVRCQLSITTKAVEDRFKLKTRRNGRLEVFLS